jgi:hypothetical protein
METLSNSPPDYRGVLVRRGQHDLQRFIKAAALLRNDSEKVALANKLFGREGIDVIAALKSVDSM